MPPATLLPKDEKKKRSWRMCGCSHDAIDAEADKFLEDASNGATSNSKFRAAIWRSGNLRGGKKSGNHSSLDISWYSLLAITRL